MTWTPERRAAQAERIRRLKPWERSTGPKSEQGKRAASLNGLRPKRTNELKAAPGMEANQPTAQENPGMCAAVEAIPETAPAETNQAEAAQPEPVKAEDPKHSTGMSYGRAL